MACPGVKNVGLSLSWLSYCQTKSDNQQRFTNYHLKLFVSDLLNRDTVSTSVLSETCRPYVGPWSILLAFTATLCMNQVQLWWNQDQQRNTDWSSRFVLLNLLSFKLDQAKFWNKTQKMLKVQNIPQNYYSATNWIPWIGF